MRVRARWVIAAALVMLLGLAVAYRLVPQGGRIVLLEGQTIHVAIADTPALREKGLGGRTGLRENEGMLFIFPEDGIYPFWMKDMRISLDIVWLDAAGQVVFMKEDAAPSSFPAAFTPAVPARYVLELPAGWASAHGVQIGDSAQL